MKLKCKRNKNQVLKTMARVKRSDCQGLGGIEVGAIGGAQRIFKVIKLLCRIL